MSGFTDLRSSGAQMRDMDDVFVNRGGDTIEDDLHMDAEGLHIYWGASGAQAEVYIHATDTRAGVKVPQGQGVTDASLDTTGLRLEDTSGPVVNTLTRDNMKDLTDGTGGTDSLHTHP